MKDETKETKQDTLQEPEQAPAGSEGTTPKAKAKTHTEDEVAKQVHTALCAAGRDAKSLEERETAIKAREDAIRAKDDAQDATEFAEAQGDPDKMAVYQKRQTEKQRKTGLDAREAALNKREAEHEAEITVARDTMLEVKIWQIATKYKVDPVALKNLNLPTVAQIEEVAKVMPKLPPKGEGETPEELSIDSAVTSGGQGEPTQEQLEKMPMPRYAAYVEKRDSKK